jgi:hypothetical protein
MVQPTGGGAVWPLAFVRASKCGRIRQQR